MYKDVLNNNFCNAKGNPLPTHTHTHGRQPNHPPIGKLCISIQQKTIPSQVDLYVLKPQNFYLFSKKH